MGRGKKTALGNYIMNTILNYEAKVVLFKCNSVLHLFNTFPALNQCIADMYRGA